jgi:hypothetical protein
VGRESTSRFIVKNDGEVPAVAKIEFPDSVNFTVTLADAELIISTQSGGRPFSERSGSAISTMSEMGTASQINASVPLTPQGRPGSGRRQRARPNLTFHLDPQQTASVDVRYHPQSPGVHADSVRITAENNEYDEALVVLKGEAFESVVTFENLPPLPAALTPQDLASLFDATALSNAQVVLGERRREAAAAAAVAAAAQPAAKPTATPAKPPQTGTPQGAKGAPPVDPNAEAA